MSSRQQDSAGRGPILADLPRDLLNKVFTLLSEKDLWQCRRTSLLFAEAYQAQVVTDRMLVSREGWERIFHLAKKGYRFPKLNSIVIYDFAVIQLINALLFPQLSKVYVFSNTTQSLPHHPGVTSLDLRVDELRSIEILSGLSERYPFLQSLTVIANLKRLPQLPSTLKFLMFEGCEGQWFNDLRPLSELVTLRLFQTNISSSQLQRLPVDFPSLRELTINQCSVGLSDLPPLPNLEHLRLTNSSDVIHCRVEAGKFPSLYHLDLQGSLVESLPVLPHVTFLNIGRWRSMNNEALRNLAEWTSLETLVLRGIRLPQSPEFSRMPSLRTLVLAYCSLDSANLGHLGPETFPNLKCLVLSGNGNLRLHTLPSHPLLEVVNTGANLTMGFFGQRVPADRSALTLDRFPRLRSE